MRPLAACYDMLADAFGIQVFLRRRDDGMIECPQCGRWHAVTVPDVLGIRLSCTCGLSLPCALCEDTTWVTVATTEILKVPRSRLFIPRAWNVQERGWIQKQVMSEMLMTFYQERDSV